MSWGKQEDWLALVARENVLDCEEVDNVAGGVDLLALLVLIEEPRGELVILHEVFLGALLGDLGHEIVQACVGLPHVLG